MKRFTILVIDTLRPLLIAAISVTMLASEKAYFAEIYAICGDTAWHILCIVCGGFIAITAVAILICNAINALDAL